MTLRIRYSSRKNGIVKELRFSDRLASAMARRNLTVSELAKASGVHYVMISRYLKADSRGKLPSVETLISLAETLDCTIDELVGREIAEVEATSAVSEEAAKVGQFFDQLDDNDNLKRLLTLAISELEK